MNHAWKYEQHEGRLHMQGLESKPGFSKIQVFDKPQKTVVYSILTLKK